MMLTPFNIMGYKLLYDNTPMQYTAFFHGCKNYNFQMKKCDNFLSFAQILIVSTRYNEYPQSMF